MTDHEQVTGTGWGQEQCVSMSSEAKGRGRRAWAVRKAGKKPGNPSPIYGALLQWNILDPNHPLAYTLPELCCFHVDCVLHTCTSPMAVSQGQSCAVLRQNPFTHGLKHE